MQLITMVLASGPGHPDGDVATRFELHAALTPNAHVDAVAYHADPLPWRTRRVEADGRVYAGELIQEEEGWAVRRTGSEDDPLWPLEIALVRPGEYVTLRPPEGEELVYRIVAIEADEGVRP